MVRANRNWIIAAMVLVLAGCAGVATQTSGPVASTAGSPKVMRVGIDPDYPPIAYKKDGKLQGIEVVLARQMGKDLGKEVQLIETPWEQLIPALNAGKIDVIMSGMSITQERKRLVSFTEPYMRIGQMAIIRTEDIGRLSSPRALYETKLRIGFVAGTTGALFVESNLVQAQPVPLKSGEAGIPALRARQIDVFIHDAPTAWRLASDPLENEVVALYWPLTEEELAWAVRTSDVQFRGELDAMIEQWKKSGRLQATLNQWIPVRVEIK
jgi:ABC-type amino acid transport substrate-binding protein